MPALALSRSVRRTAGVVALVAALAGCSSDTLDVDGFAAGACTDIAPAVQDVDESLRQVGDEDIEPREAAERFRAVRDVFEPIADGDEPVVDMVRELRTQLGFFRIAVESNKYDGSQDDAVRDALDDVVEACTA